MTYLERLRINRLIHEYIYGKEGSVGAYCSDIVLAWPLFERLPTGSHITKLKAGYKVYIPPESQSAEWRKFYADTATEAICLAAVGVLVKQNLALEMAL